MASIALQTTEIDTGGAAPRVIIDGAREVPIASLPASGQQAIDTLLSAISLATGQSNTRYLITVNNGAVNSVALATDTVQIPSTQDVLHLLLLGKTDVGARKVISAAAFAAGFIATAQELMVTSAPNLVSQLLASAGFTIEALTAYLQTVQTPDNPQGPHYLAVIRLDEAALLLAGAGYDVSALLQFIVSANWQSPERAPHPAFVPTFGAYLAGWSDVWS